MVQRTVTRMALVISGIALVACGADDHAGPGGQIVLIYRGKSNSEYFFVLKNPTSQAIFFRGSKWLWFAPTPVDTGFDCKNEKTGEGMVGGFPLFDGGKDPPPIEVSPGKTIKLRVDGDDLAGHKGETCQLHLMLWQPRKLHPQGDVVESQDFHS